MDWTPALRDAIYLDGETLAYPPEEVKPEEQRAEYSERLVDRTLFTQSPILYDGCENVPRTFSIAFRWGLVTAADRRIFSRVRASRLPKDLCIWDPIHEEFTGDGTTDTFYLGRRIAVEEISPLPPGAETRYATVITVDDVVQVVTTDYTLGTATDLGRQPFTCTSAPADGAVILVEYVPLFLVKVITAETGFIVPHGMSQMLVLEEVA